jgi:hypothetical protein
VRYLIDRGANVNEQASNDRRFPLYLGVSSLPMTKLLLENGAIPNMMNALKNTALTIAACDGLVQQVELLLQFGADPNADPMGFHLACQNGHIETAELLIKHGAQSIAINGSSTLETFGMGCQPLMSGEKRRAAVQRLNAAFVLAGKSSQIDTDDEKLFGDCYHQVTRIPKKEFYKLSVKKLKQLFVDMDIPFHNDFIEKSDIQTALLESGKIELVEGDGIVILGEITNTGASL